MSKKKKAQTESNWVNKPVFFALLGLTLASTITACTLIYRGIDDVGRVSSDVSDSPAVVEVVPEPIIVEKVIEIPQSDAEMLMINGLAEHLQAHHNLKSDEVLFKCASLSSNLYSCKIVQGKEPDPNAEKPEVELPNAEPEKGHEANSEKPKERWDPFK